MTGLHMIQLSAQNLGVLDWAVALFSLSLLAILASAAYNLLLHPLRHIPGPLLARATGIPSWYHAYRGDRHIWLWQQFQIHGNKIRPEPNTVLFRDPDAYADIYGMKSNVQRSDFYKAWMRNDQDKNTMITVVVREHTRKRRHLSLAFTEKSIRAASAFVIRHVDHWNQLLVEECGTEWSAPTDLSEAVDALSFDIMGDLSFGKSFNVKEPGKNPLKSIPHSIAKHLQFAYPICRSPLLALLLWLKPRGLNRLFGLLTPPDVKQYYQFVEDSVTDRLELQAQQMKKPEEERRQDMFHFLCEARDPASGEQVYDEAALRAEAHLLIVAGSDTTAISLSGIMWYLLHDPQRYQKLVDELLATFESANDIVLGPKLSSCVYLRACIDEGMRLTPPVASELPRTVLPGGLKVKGEYFPAGTILGSSSWVDSRNEEVYGDAHAFRPERWIVDPAAGITKEDVSRIRSNLHPFAAGPGNCVGQNLAMAEMMITMARTLYRLDIRQVPGSTVGGGGPELGWGARDKNQFQLIDAYVSLRHGPEVQFRSRAARA